LEQAGECDGGPRLRASEVVLGGPMRAAPGRATRGVPAYSSASRQISTATSSTLSGIGGSGLVAFTHTPSSA
jgi:hypothetical protein